MQMSVDSIDFFIHDGRLPPRLVKAYGDELLETVLRREGVGLDHAIHLFASNAADEVDEAGEEPEPLPAGLTVADGGIKRHSHVHCQRCRRVQVSVNYQSRTAQRMFWPNAQIRRIRRWAQKSFGLIGPAAGDFVLQPCGSDIDAGLQQGLAEFIRDDTCSVCFDFSKELTPQG